MRDTLPSYMDSQGEDEEERRRRALLESFLSLQSQGSAAGESQPLAADDPAEAPARNAGVTSRARALLSDQEMDEGPVVAPRERSGGGGMDAQTIFALLLDAGLNRGQGIGQMLGAYAANQEANARERRQHQLRREQIAAQERGRKMDPFRQMLELDKLEARAADRALRDKALAGTQTRFDTTRADKSDINSAVNQTQLQLAEGRSGANVRGRELEMQELRDVITENAAAESGARATAATNARTDALRQNPAALTEQQSLQNELAQSRHELDLQRESRQQAKDDRAARLGRTPIPGAEAVPGQETVWEAAIADPKTRANITRSIQAIGAAGKALEHMQALRAEHGANWGGDMGPSADYDTSRNAVLGAMGVLANTGVLHEHEYHRFVENLDSIDAWKSPLATLISGVSSYDPTAEKLDGVRQGLAKYFEDWLSPYGGTLGGGRRAAAADGGEGDLRDALPMGGPAQRPAAGARELPLPGGPGLPEYDHGGFDAGGETLQVVPDWRKRYEEWRRRRVQP